MNKKIKAVIYGIFVSVCFLCTGLSMLNINLIKTYANTSDNKWDDTWHISKDELYSYYVSKDGKWAKIFYYEGPWNIKKLVIPKTIDGYIVTSIGNRESEIQWAGPFHYLKDSVEEIEIPDTVTEIGTDTFAYLSKLKKVKMPEHMEDYADRLFYGCTSLKEIPIPKQLKIIGEYAFGETAITNINLPDSITYIGNNAFSYCTNLKEVNLPNSITFIGGNAFWSCTNLEKVSLPSNLDRISGGAFNNTAIREIMIPDSVTAIETCAFRFCKDLKYIKFSKNLTYVGEGAFDGTDWLASRSKEDYTMINDTIILSYNGDEESPVIPDGTKFIVDAAFANKSLIEIIIPDSVEYIGNYAFSNCTNLKKVILPKNLKEINNCVFYHDIALESIKLPDSVITIGWEAFKKCNKLKEIEVSPNIKQVEKDAFSETPWLKTKSGDEYIMLQNILLKYNGSNMEPVIPSDTIGIAGGAFANKSLSRIVIPETVEFIGSEAFKNTQLDNVLFLGNAPEIAKYALINSNEFALTYTKVYYTEGKTGFDSENWNKCNPSVYEDKNLKIEDNKQSSGQSDHSFSTR